MKLQQLRALGFDESAHVPFTKTYKVKCSQCAALVINGIPAHENGCHNAMRECEGCNTLLPATMQKYCEDCS